MRKSLTYMMLGAFGVLAYQSYNNKNDNAVDKAMKKMSEMNRDTMKWIKSKM